MCKTLVAYFSASGVTARAAKNLAKAAGADLYEILPAVPYTSADLDWNDKRSRSSLEMNDKASCPELKGRNAPITEHDTIFLAFPNMEQGFECVLCAQRLKIVENKDCIHKRTRIVYGVGQIDRKYGADGCDRGY